MATHTLSSTPSPAHLGRRAALGTLLAGGASAAGISAGVAARMPQPDTELIRLCAEFDVIERRLQATSADDEDRWDAAYKAARAEQEPLLDRIAELQPTTMDGFAALARSLLLWTAGDFANHGNTDDMLASAIVRGLAGRA